LVVWPTSIGAGGVFVNGVNEGSSELVSDGAESADMSASDRDRAGAFGTFSTLRVTEVLF